MFGAWLEEIAKGHGLNQDQLAAACGVQQQAVSAWYRGIRYPTRHLIALSRAIGVPAEELHDRIEADRPNGPPAVVGPATPEVEALERRVAALEDLVRQLGA